MFDSFLIDLKSALLMKVFKYISDIDLLKPIFENDKLLSFKYG